MTAVDKIDSAQLDAQEIENPEGYYLLAFLLDPRTGLGRFRDFRISNYQLMNDMIDLLALDIKEILRNPDVADRVDLYKRSQPDFVKQVNRIKQEFGPILILDYREEDIIYPGNRFQIYQMFPHTQISILVLPGIK